MICHYFYFIFFFLICGQGLLNYVTLLVAVSMATAAVAGGRQHPELISNIKLSIYIILCPIQLQAAFCVLALSTTRACSHFCSFCTLKKKFVYVKAKYFYWACRHLYLYLRHLCWLRSSYVFPNASICISYMILGQFCISLCTWILIYTLSYIRIYVNWLAATLLLSRP